MRNTSAFAFPIFFLLLVAVYIPTAYTHNSSHAELALLETSGLSQLTASKLPCETDVKTRVLASLPPEAAAPSNSELAAMILAQFRLDKQKAADGVVTIIQQKYPNLSLSELADVRATAEYILITQAGPLACITPPSASDPNSNFAPPPPAEDGQTAHS